jgi:hypothetical protein
MQWARAAGVDHRAANKLAAVVDVDATRSILCGNRCDTTEIIVSKPTFHTMVIAGREFEGLLSADGPYISCGFEGVALGSCTTIELLSPEIDSGVGRNRVSSPSWWIAKYHTQPRVSLAATSDHERHLLAREFGIRVLDTDCVAQPFWGSPAFRSLAEWVKKNPRAAARFRRYDAYLPDWYSAACAWDGERAELPS